MSTPPPLAAPAAEQSDEAVKSCCAAVYSSDWARLLLGDSFHPGGLALTERLGERLGLAPGVRVLDVAAGRGASALHLAGRFGCDVTGVDLSAANVAAANAAAERAGLAERARFVEGDAERLTFAAGSFDAVVCECAFCTFPSKPAAAAEFARVLRPGGRLGLSDLTRTDAPLPPELQTLIAWVACIADARPVAEYLGYLSAAGFGEMQIEPRDEALAELVRGIRQKLLGVELFAKLGKLTLPGTIDFAAAKSMAKAAAEAVTRGQLGYAIITAARG
jgi:SAM-dependent methyltransferase